MASSPLLQTGVTQTYPESIEASLRLGAEALQMLGAPADRVDQLLQGVRERGYKIVGQDMEHGKARRLRCIPLSAGMHFLSPLGKIPAYACHDFHHQTAPCKA